MSLPELLKLNEAESQYLKTVQRFLKYSQKTEADTLVEVAEDILKRNPRKREKWVNKGVPYNTQDILTQIALDYVQSGQDPDIYAAHNRVAMTSHVVSIEEERTEFSSYSK